MKKALMASLLSVFLGAGVLFGGCGNNTIPNDLSEINIQITELQQQIKTLNQTILELQTRLNQAEQNQQELLLDLTTAQGQLLELQEQVFGKVNNYYQINETLSYSISGIKLFDFTVTSADFLDSTYHRIHFNFYSYVNTIDNIENESLALNFLFYDYSTQKSYSIDRITEQVIIFSLNIPDTIRNGLFFLCQGSTIIGIYEINFDELSS